MKNVYENKKNENAPKWQRFLTMLALVIFIVAGTSFNGFAQPFTVTGDDKCAGQTANIGLDNSTLNFNYYLLKTVDNINYTYVTYQVGQGIPLAYGPQTATGKYVVYQSDIVTTNPVVIATGILQAGEVYINPLPVPTISGLNSVCANSTNTYTTESGASGYTWTIVGGTGSSNTHIIAVTWDNIPGGTHSVSVNYSLNSCQAASATNYPVTVSGNVMNTLTGIYYCTIQDAINAAGSGNTISVGAGIFLESDILIDKPLTLQGAGQTSTFINPDPTKVNDHACSPTGGTVHHGIIIKAQDVTIKDLTIDGGNEKGYRMGISSGYWDGGPYNNSTIQNVTVTNIGYRGIVLRMNNALTTGHKVLDCTVSNGGCDEQGFAILGFNTDNTEIARCTVTNFQEGIATGNYLGTLTTCNIHNNNVTGVPYQAYTLTSNGTAGSTASIFDHNTASYSVTAPATSIGLVTYQCQLTLTNNTFTGIFTGIGVGSETAAKSLFVIGAGNVLTGPGNTVTGSIGIDASDLTGSWEGEARNFTVQNTTITGYEKGISIKPYNGMSADALITGNKIFGNGIGLKNEYVGANNPISAENNWWGDASGPKNIPNNTCGIGNSVEGSVDFMPWWNTETGGSATLAVHNVTKDTYFCKIQEAITDANSGDVIEVAAGTYDVSTAININKGIEIHGASYGLLGTASARTSETILLDIRTPSSDPGAFTIGTTNPVVIDGITLQGSKIVSGQPANANLTFRNDRMILAAMPNSGQTGMIFSTGCVITLDQNYFETTGFNASNSALFQVAGGYTESGSSDNMIVTNNIFKGIPNTSTYNDGNGQSTLQLNFSACQGNISGNTFDEVDIGVIIAGASGNMSITGNTFENIKRDVTKDLPQGNYGAGVVIFNPSYIGPVTISRNTFQSSDCGIRTSTDGSSFTETGSNIHISNNTFTGNVYDIADKMPSVTFTLDGDNTIAGATLSSATTSQLFAIEDKIVHKVDNSGYGLVIAKPDNLFVTTNSFFTPAGTTAPSIQRAIDAASSGWTVNVGAGAFDNSIDITKPLQVLGQGKTNTFLDRSTNASAGNVVDIHDLAGDVKVDGFTIKTGPASTVASNAISISGLTGPGTITVTNNEIWGVQSATATAFDNYSLIAGYFTATTPKLVFDHNTVHGGSDNPILIERWMGPTEITNNSLYQNPLKDFSVSDVIFMMNHDGSHNTAKQLISGNTIDMGWGTTNQRGAGITVSGAFVGTTPSGFTNVEISGNTILNLKPNRRGISTYNNSSDGTSGDITAVITGNTISNATGFTGEFGIRVLGKATGTTITDNIISGVTDAVKIQDWNSSPSGISVTNNSLTNSTFGINNLTANNVAGTCNWYGTNVSSGVAAKISGDVQFLPFSTSASPMNCSGIGPVVNTSNEPDRSYMTIQAAIDASTTIPGDVIEVASGTYAENVTVTKSLTLLGPKAAVDGCDASRGTDEAIIVPATNDLTDGVVFNVLVSNVTIKGFTIDGDNPSISGGNDVFGADVNAVAGINNGKWSTAPWPDIDHLTVQNNVIKDFVSDGIYVGNSFGTNYSWNYIQNNKFEKMREGVQTYALHADISNNCMTSVNRGISTHGTNTASDLLFTHAISNNDITISWAWIYPGLSRAIGIWNNYQRDNASELSVHDNTIRFPEATPSGSTSIGIYALSMDNNRVVNYNDNTVIGNGNCNIDSTPKSDLCF